jgi:uncharacterized heparinase superfamily protein
VLRASLYFHTLRYLRREQVFARLRYRLAPALVRVRAAPSAAPKDGRWIAPPSKAASLVGPMRVRFLNRERDLKVSADWHDGAERLWLYNLHYFDDLVAKEAASRASWHDALIATWIRDNPPARGVGWESYPISLRAVNWIKWSLGGKALDGGACSSLATQLRYLRRRIEWHLLGNHLLANAKALIFGGLFFAGHEADEWLEFGSRLFHEQLAEQVLPDGGHFERSPMYHALSLEDVLDVINAMQTYAGRQFTQRATLSSSLPATAAKMLPWLEAMTHPDGEIAFFNDAAFAIALPPSKLKAYAEMLRIKAGQSASRLVDLASSGYVRLQQGQWCVLFDAAPVGPDYQPGHAHADTLAFELSIGGERLISNSGTSTYEQGPQRAFERSTRAHNSVEIDGENSSEVWAGFRVARRARPLERTVEAGKDHGFVSCAHDGYRRLAGQPSHRRSLEVTGQEVRWVDRVEGAGRHRAKGFIPLHPGVQFALDGTKAKLRTSGGRRLLLSGEGFSGFMPEEGSWAREFGLREPRAVLTWELPGGVPLEARFVLRVEP